MSFFERVSVSYGCFVSMSGTPFLTCRAYHTLESSASFWAQSFEIFKRFKNLSFSHIFVVRLKTTPFKRDLEWAKILGILYFSKESGLQSVRRPNIIKKCRWQVLETSFQKKKNCLRHNFLENFFPFTLQLNSWFWLFDKFFYRGVWGVFEIVVRYHQWGMSTSIQINIFEIFRGGS